MFHVLTLYFKVTWLAASKKKSPQSNLHREGLHRRQHKTENKSYTIYIYEINLIALHDLQKKAQSITKCHILEFRKNAVNNSGI